MKSKRFGIAAAMEQIEEAEAATAAAIPEEKSEPVEEELDIPVAEDTVETAVGEMDMSESEVDQADEAIDSAEVDNGTLVDLADKLEATEETGGIDASSAAVIEVAVESIYARLGVRRNKPFLAMESFGSSSSRKKATSIAVENIREQAQSIGKAISVMIQKAWEFVKNFFATYFTAVGKIRERAQKLKEALSKITNKDSVVGSETIEAKEFSASLMFGDEVKPEAISKFLDDIKPGFMDNLQADVYDTPFFKDTLLNLVTDDAAYKNAMSTVPASPDEDGVFEKVTTSEFGSPDENSDFYKLVMFPGLPADKYVIMQAMKKELYDGTEESSIKGMGLMKLFVSDGSDKVIETLKVLSIEDCVKLVDSVLAACDSINQLKTNYEKIEKAFNKISNNMALSGLKTATKEKDAEYLKRIGILTKSVRLVIMGVTKPMVITSKAGISVCKATLQYVALSAKAHHSDGGEEKPAAA